MRKARRPQVDGLTLVLVGTGPLIQANNMVQLAGFDGAPGNAPGPGNVLVLFEPKDPEPAHRYKMMILVEPAVGKNMNNILPFYG